MKVLVTGGAGYIGSHACKVLALAGHEPIVYDNLVNGHRWAVQWGPLEVGDISNSDQLDVAFKTYKPDAVMHFAAYAYVGESVSDPGKYYRNNVVGSLTLLEAARKYQVDKLVFSSTCATYGIPHSLLIDENHPQLPINPYGRSKLMVEHVLRDFDQAYGLRSISLRYFNAAGADPDGDIGECHDPETHLIPLALDAASGNGPPLTVYGDDYDTPDGTGIRDYIHVEDLARAHVMALEDLNRGSATTAYNLANGKGFSVREALHAVDQVTKLAVPHIVGPRREGDPASLVGDAKKIGEELGWHPHYHDLKQIIETAWRWHLKSSRNLV